MDDSSDRMINAKKQIIASFGIKGISVLFNLLLIPLTLNYLDSERYGIWLTMTSLVAWAAYFDIGLTHGFRNQFSIQLSNNNILKARSYLSTSYVLMGIFCGCIFLIGLLVSSLLSWSSILNVDFNFDNELKYLFFILLFFFCFSMILNVFNAMLMAAQKPALPSFISVIGQLFIIGIIYFLLKTNSGNLLIFSGVFSGVPVLILLVFTFIGYRTVFKKYKPSIKLVDFSLTRNIIGLGGKFFIIQISTLIIFQMINIILSRTQGAESVTQYNICFKYFSLVLMLISIIFTPFWSAFTDAFSRGELQWMAKTYYTLSRIWWYAFFMVVFMLIVCNYAYKVWLQDSISIPIRVSCVMALYILCLTRANLYTNLINGTGFVFVQSIVSIIFSLISIPLMFYASSTKGIVGITLVTITFTICQCIFGHVQLHKILSGKARGYWKK